jgi:hypothetical protein
MFLRSSALQFLGRAPVFGARHFNGLGALKLLAAVIQLQAR